MVTPVSRNEVSSSPQFREAILRRQLQAEINEIHELLNQSPLHDETSETIREWTKHFSLTLQHEGNEQWILNQFTHFLQQILTDAITQGPLDHDSLLGSDGRAYGRMSLSVFLSTISEELRHRCPLDLNNPQPFTTTPHPIVSKMVTWLEQHGQLLHSAAIEKDYHQLVKENRLPSLPTKQTLWKEKIKTRYQEMRQAQESQAAEFADEIRAPKPNDAQIQQIFNEMQNLRLRMQEGLDEVQARARQLQGWDRTISRNDDLLQAQIRRIQEGFAQLEIDRARFEINVSKENAENQLLAVQNQLINKTDQFFRDFEALKNEFQAQMSLVNQAAQNLETQVQDLETETDELRNQVNRTNANLTQAERRIAELTLSIKEVEKAIKKRKSGQLKSLALTAACIGASIFGGWALTQALSGIEGAAGGSVLATRQGLEVGLTFVF